MGGSAIMAKVRPYIGTTTSWFVGQAAHIGKLLVYCGLMLLFSALLYWRGEQVAYGFRYFATRLAAKRGDAAVLLAGRAVRAVALGVVVTALTQAVLGGIGLAVSGVPYAALLTVVMIFTCLVQLGPLLVLVPSIIWLYWAGTPRGTVLLVWSCVVGTMDNVIRPVLIRMGADLPMILILTGVIGGLIAFGMIGLFIGRCCSPSHGGCMTHRCMRCRRRRKTLTSSLKSLVSWRPVASNAAGGETRLFLCPHIVKQNLLIAGNALAPRALHLAFLPRSFTTI